jgi:hypothetical protein
MKSESTQDLTQTTKTIVQSIKAIQKHCKDNNINLQTSLTPKEYQQFQADVALVKKYMPEIKADIWATKQEAEKDVDPKDISEPAFVDAVLQWRKKLLEDFLKTKNNYADVVIEPSTFSQNINSNSSALPLNEALYKEWAALIDKIPSPSTGAIVFDALINNNSETWTIVGNKSALMTHYRIRANKKVYKEYEDTRIDGALPQIALFLAAIKASTSADDANLPATEAEKEKAAAYQKVLNAWKAEEIANLKFSPGEDTLLVDMSRINENVSNVVVHNFPETSKVDLLQSIRLEAKKLHPRSRQLSVKVLKVLAVSKVTEFHSNNSSKKENYEALTLEEIKALKFPTNVAGWIIDAAVGKTESEAQDAKFLVYGKVFDAWYKEEHLTLSDTNASEDIRIDPSLLDLKSGKVSDATIPTSIAEQLLSSIKNELIKEEKARGTLNYNDAAAYANNVLETFKADYNPYKETFKYKDLSVEEILVLKFPSGLASWIKECRIEGADSKDDIKIKVKAQLKLVLKNTNNFNLEALIKELKIDMGGLTINNDFNFDNDMNLTYNSLSLILKELVKINKAKAPKKKPRTKVKTASAELIIKDFYASYYDSCHYGGNLKLQLNSEKDSEGAYTLTFGEKIEIEKPNASLLKLYRTVLETVPPVRLKKNENTVIKIDFALTYTYNKKTSISKTKESAYVITEVGANAGAEVSIRFAKLYAGADFKQINVPQKEGETSTQGTTDKTFTDYYTFEIVIKNTEDGIELGSGDDISFADSNYVRILPQLKEIIGLCGNVELQ